MKAMPRRLLAVVLLAGCTPAEFAFSPTVTVVTPKSENCSVEVVTSTPSRTFQEIGTLEFYNGPEPKTLDDFKKAVAKQVCSAGGDAVVAEQDAKGLYTKGTVIKYMGPAVGAKPGAPPDQQTDTEVPKH
jgi:hypothetical protein